MRAEFSNIQSFAELVHRNSNILFWVNEKFPDFLYLANTLPYLYSSILVSLAYVVVSEHCFRKIIQLLGTVPIANLINSEIITEGSNEM